MSGPLIHRRYLLQELLGAGGMGQVFQAYDTKRRARVAIKLLHGAEGELKARHRQLLAHEVRAVARLDHPGIVHLIDSGYDGARAFLVMALVPGRPLRDWMWALTLRELVGLLDEVLGALAYAHARGVIHRDLKPENILIVEDERGRLSTRLVDFGVAQFMDLEERAALGAGVREALARRERIAGTPLYMAPEQLLGRATEIHRGCDLYALGVMLYELAAGHPPYQGEGVAQLALAHVRDPIPALTPRPGVQVPEGYEGITRRLLAKQPEARYAYAADVRGALRALRWPTRPARQRGGARPSPWRPGDAPVTGVEVTLDSQGLRDAGPAPTPLVGVESEAADAAATMEADAQATPALLEAPGGRLGTQVTLGLDPAVGEARGPAATKTVASALLEQALRSLSLTSTGDARAGEASEGAALPAPELLALREPPLLGHDAARERLEAARLGVIEDGAPRLVMVHGPPGAGKSRLARWLAETVEEAGAMRVVACGVGVASGLPGGGLRAIFEYAFNLHGAPRPDCERALTRHLVKPGVVSAEELGLLLDYLRPADAEAPELLEARALDPVPMAARVLRALALERPVLLWVDDLSGPEAPPLLELIDFLLATHMLTPTPMLIVVTLGACPQPSMRDPHLGARVWRVLEDAARLGASLALEPLDGAQIAALGRALLPLDAASARRLVDGCQGRPGFVLPVLRGWLEQGWLEAGDDGTLRLMGAPAEARPGHETGARMWLRRLTARLEQSEDREGLVSVLVSAAVCGRRVELTLLERVVGSQGVDATRCVHHWEALVNAGWLLEVGAEAARFADEALHTLLIERLLDPAHAARIHADVAEAIIDLAGEGLAQRHGEVAMHLEAAGELDRACEHMLAAARQLRRWGRYEEAARWLEATRALIASHPLRDASTLADRVDLELAEGALRTARYDAAARYLDGVAGRARSGVRARHALHACLLRAELMHRRGALDEAITLYEAAEVDARALADRHRRALALRGVAEVLIIKARYDRALVCVHEAQALLGALGARIDQGEALVIEARVLSIQRRFDAAVARYEAALACFKAEGAQHQAAETRFYLAAVFGETGQLDVAIARLDALCDRILDVGDQRLLANCLRSLGQYRRSLGDFEGARVVSQEALTISERIGDRQGVVRALNGLGEGARAAQDWARACEHYEACVAAAEDLGDPLAIALGSANLGLVHAERARWSQAARAFERAVELMEAAGQQLYSGAFSGCLGHAYAREGRFDAAAEAIERVLAIDAARPLVIPDLLCALEGYLACAARRDLARSRRILTMLEARWAALGDAEAATRLAALRAALASAGG